MVLKDSYYLAFFDLQDKYNASLGEIQASQVPYASLANMFNKVKRSLQKLTKVLKIIKVFINDMVNDNVQWEKMFVCSIFCPYFWAFF